MGRLRLEASLGHGSLQIKECEKVAAWTVLLAYMKWAHVYLQLFSIEESSVVDSYDWQIFNKFNSKTMPLFSFDWADNSCHFLLKAITQAALLLIAQI